MNKQHCIINTMDIFIQKFNEIRMERIFLEDVKELIYERYIELCERDIRHKCFHCSWCDKWCPRKDRLASLDMCDGCVDKKMGCDSIFNLDDTYNITIIDSADDMHEQEEIDNVFSPEFSFDKE